MKKSVKGFVVVPLILAAALVGLVGAAGVYVFNHHAVPQIEKVVK